MMWWRSGLLAFTRHAPRGGCAVLIPCFSTWSVAAGRPTCLPAAAVGSQESLALASSPMPPNHTPALNAPSVPLPQGHEIELLDQLTGGLVVPTAAGEDGAAGGPGATASQQAEAVGSGEAFRPSTFSFLRTLRSEEAEGRGEEEGGEGPGAVDPAAAEATRRAFEGAVLAQWQRLRAARVA